MNTPRRSVLDELELSDLLFAGLDALTTSLLAVRLGMNIGLCLLFMVLALALRFWYVFHLQRVFVGIQGRISRTPACRRMDAWMRVLIRKPFQWRMIPSLPLYLLLTALILALMALGSLLQVLPTLAMAGLVLGLNQLLGH